MFNRDGLLNAGSGLSTHLRRRSGELLSQGSCGQLGLPDLGELRRRASDVCLGAAGNLLAGSSKQLDQCAKSPSLYFPKAPSPVRRTSATSLGLGSLNPDLYNDPSEGDLDIYPDGHNGRLWFTLEHAMPDARLRVTVDKCRNAPLQEGYSCLVRVALTGNEDDYRETKTKKDRDAEFNETLDLELSAASSSTSSAILTLLEQGPRRLRRPLGRVHFPLSDYARCKKRSLTVWRDLKRVDAAEQVTGGCGQLCVALAFDAGTLKVGLVEAKQLVTKNGKPTDTYCKLTLSTGGKSSTTKKSTTCRKCLDPVYNCALDFKLASGRRDSAHLTINVMQTAGAASVDKCIGRVIVGGAMAECAGAALEHWKDALATTGGQPVEMWHFLHE